MNDIIHFWIGAMGFLVSIDKNGDASGNYTLIARKRQPSSRVTSSAFGLFPIGIFQMPSNSSHIPVSLNPDLVKLSLLFTTIHSLQHLQLWSEIDWISDSGTPSDEPLCGFDGEKCQGNIIPRSISLPCLRFP